MERKINIEINTILNGDCIEKLKTLPDNSVDSIVTDPPYELKFMDKAWDGTGITFSVELWEECLRVLKHGGHLLSFGGTRTYHRMACAIEDAGFEIRDQIQWLYGSGFPKSYNISKGIDKKLGKERQVVGEKKHPTAKSGNRTGEKSPFQADGSPLEGSYKVTVPASEESKYWEGWGTALKPANEPIVLARKPLKEKTIVENVLEWGTGGLNINESKIGNDKIKSSGEVSNAWRDKEKRSDRQKANPKVNEGRFPANVILDEEAASILDEQTGTLKSGKNAVRRQEGFFLEHGGLGKSGDVQTTYGDSGGASRFFYCAKATSKKEKGEYNNHPTVKPIKLMEYLVNLVTPKEGIVLDPFVGSGSTLVAAKNRDFNYIGIEKEEEYIEICNKRLDSIST